MPLAIYAVRRNAGTQERRGRAASVGPDEARCRCSWSDAVNDQRREALGSGELVAALKSARNWAVDERRTPHNKETRRRVGYNGAGIVRGTQSRTGGGFVRGTQSRTHGRTMRTAVNASSGKDTAKNPVKALQSFLQVMGSHQVQSEGTKSSQRGSTPGQSSTRQ